MRRGAGAVVHRSECLQKTKKRGHDKHLNKKIRMALSIDRIIFDESFYDEGSKLSDLERHIIESHMITRFRSSAAIFCQNLWVTDG